MGPFNMGRERYARDKSIASFIYFIFGYYMQKNKGIDGYFTFENVWEYNLWQNTKISAAPNHPQSLPVSSKANSK